MLSITCSIEGCAQSHVFVGIETGALLDRAHFIGASGQTLSGGALSGLSGLTFGVEHNTYFFSSGIYRLKHGFRVFELDRSNGRFEKVNESFNFMGSIVIPLHIAKEFKLINKWHLRLGIGLLGFIPMDTGDTFNVISFQFDPPQSGQPQVPSADSTKFSWGTNRSFNMALETSVKVVYRTRGRVNLLANGAFQAHFVPIYEGSFQYFSAHGAEFGQSVGLNSIAISLGLQYNLKRRHEKKPDM